MSLNTAQLVVKNTFISVDRRLDTPPRSRSAPPRFHDGARGEAAAAAAATDAPGDVVDKAETLRAEAVARAETDWVSAVQLRGLPFSATVEDVRSFMGEHAAWLVEDSPIHLLLNSHGRRSGFARVQFVSPEAARQCRDGLHRRPMAGRYVEVFLYNVQPINGRQRRGLLEAGGPEADALAASREQVVRECRACMADPGKRRARLAKLGENLSSSRSYLKLSDQPLTQCLANFPNEFSVKGRRGKEYVEWRRRLLLSEPPRRPGYRQQLQGRLREPETPADAGGPADITTHRQGEVRKRLNFLWSELPRVRVIPLAVFNDDPNSPLVQGEGGTATRCIEGRGEV